MKLMNSEIHLNPSGSARVTGKMAHSARAKLVLDLLSPLAHLVPTAVTLHFSDHDLGSWLVGDDLRELALRAVKENRYLSREELRRYERKEKGWVKAKGIAAACPSDSVGYKRNVDGFNEIREKGEWLLIS
jgi:hypothetical protein